MGAEKIITTFLAVKQKQNEIGLYMKSCLVTVNVNVTKKACVAVCTSKID